MPTTVEILHKGMRVASDVRNRNRGQTITHHEHRPRATRPIWNGHRRGCSIGPNRRAKIPRNCSNESWPTNRTRRWVIVPAWGLSD